MKITKIALVFVCLAVATIPSVAQQNDEVTSQLKAFKITLNQSGDEVATEVEEVRPGDLIEYRLTYTNNLDNSISNLVPVLPIPAEMYYLGNTASPEINRASYLSNGDNFQTPPLTRKEKTASGLEVTKEVPPREYRRLQWMVNTLQGGESVTLTARVRVNKKAQ